MKYLIRSLAALLFLLSFNLTAQQGINYKALIKDGSGNVVANDLIAIQFTILKGAGMTNVYRETHAPTTDANGIVVVVIGEGSVDSGVFADIDWGSDEYHLNVQIDTGGGLTDMGTTQFMAVPYALHAQNIPSNSLKIDDLLDAKTDANSTSIFLGTGAGSSDDGTDNLNVAIGLNNLVDNVSGFSNTAVGANALRNNTANSNTGIGSRALRDNTTGTNNTGVGADALLHLTIGDNNTAIGMQSMWGNTVGNRNTAVGSDALFSNLDGNNNIAVGRNALYSNISSDNNIALGLESLFSNTDGTGNLAVGHSALYTNSSGKYNTAVGFVVDALLGSEIKGQQKQ